MTTPPEQPAVPESPHHLERQRRENRDKVRESGLLPYGKRVDDLMTIAHARTLHSEREDRAYEAAVKAVGKDAPSWSAPDNRAIVKVAGAFA